MTGNLESLRRAAALAGTGAGDCNHFEQRVSWLRGNGGENTHISAVIAMENKNESTNGAGTIP
ncbi:MAG: hypothetical protein WC620_07250 [Methanoregula sp.]